MATSDETKDDGEFKTQETRGDLPPVAAFASVMNSYAREFIFILAVAFTAIAALQNGPLKTRKANPPVLFFEEPSLITDFYQGDLANLIALLSEKDISLVMYYAPWDAKSLRTRIEFEDAAKFYHNEVFFAAINCWWPEGECSRKYKINAYPLIVLYVHDVGVIRYDAPMVANYIVAFLDNALTPIVTVQHTGELLDLQAKHEGVLVGYFSFSDGDQAPGYSQYYTSSLKALTRDPYRKLCFAVITNEKVRTKFKMKSTIYLHLWNRTEVYKKKTISSNDLLDWAYGKLPQLTQWVTPPGVKSRLLLNIIGKNPTLVMFTPRNMVFESSSYYDLFREVALDYYNCNASSQVMSLVHRIVLRRHIVQEAVSKLLGTCKLSHPGETENICMKDRDRCDLMCCKTLPLALGPRGALKCSCRVCLHHAFNLASRMKLAECENTLDLVLKSFQTSLLHVDDDCHTIEAAYPTKFGSYNRLSFKCLGEEDQINFKTAVNSDFSFLDDSGEVKDDHVLSLMKAMQRNLCIRLRLAHQYSNVSFPEFPVYENRDWMVNFTGLQCQTNRTLIFVAMDALVFHSFAESLGIDILNHHHQTAAVIVDPQQESLYLLNDHINKKTLVEFVRNYTVGSLSRHLRSALRKFEPCGEDEEEGTVCVKELSTSDFLDFVLADEMDVVLMYYSPSCGPCLAVYHVFLSVANYFSNIEQIRFARIKGDEHDLPWEYTVDRYPTIVFFPAFRKENSIRYRAELQITIPNLLHFVLVNCQPKVRWVVTMRMCNRKCVAHNLVRSSSEIRHLLRDYRNLVNQLQYVRYMISEKTKPKKTKSKFQKFTSSKLASQKSEEVEWWNNYAKYLIKRIHNKKSKIRDAYKLLELLKEKRNSYFQANASSADDSSYASEESADYGDIHEPLSEMSSHVKSHIRRTRVKDEL